MTVYFASEKEIDEVGKLLEEQPKKYKAKKFYSLKPNYIKFKDKIIKSLRSESHEPMNWDLVKVA